MKIWEGIILGLVQGLTEFLPVSSSGHLFLLEKLGVGNESLFFNVCVHLGTLLSVLIVMRKKWLPLVRKPFQKTNLFILLSCLPTVGPVMDSALLAMAMMQGLTSAIINPNDRRMMETIKACDIIKNNVLYSDSFLEL